MPELNLDNVIDLLDKEAFDEAEDLLLKLRRKEQTPYINYLLGYIHHTNIPYSSKSNNKKFKGSKDEAKRHLRASIDSEEPIEDSFWRLADLEDNNKHAIRILKKGIEFFPNSELLYKHLLNLAKHNDIPLIYEELKDKKISTNSINFKMYEYYAEKNDYNEALKFLKKMKTKNSGEKQLLDLITAFILYESSDIKKAGTIFSKLIESDINHNLNYAPHIGALLCLIELSETKKLAELVDELPFVFDENFIYKPDLHFTFDDYFIQLIEKLIDFFKKRNQKEACAKIRGIKAIEAYKNDAIDKKTLLDFEYARKHLKNEILDTEAVNFYCDNDRIKAFEIDLENIEKYPNYESCADSIFYCITKDDLKKITELFLEKINEASSWSRNYYSEPMKNIISVLHQNKSHEKILKIADYFSDDLLEKSNVLFEVAYAYYEKKDKLNAKKIYEKIWDKDKNNSSVANNLALVYEDEDLYIAQELLKKALQINPNDEIAQKNLERVNIKINDAFEDINKWKKEQADGLSSVKKENVYIIGKIANLIDSENENSDIIASYSELSNILKTSPEKTQELIRNFLRQKYLFKLEAHNYQTHSNVYRLNGLVKKFVLKKKKRIEENKPLALIGEKINIDSFENLGYCDDLLSKIDLKISDHDLRDILRRDIKENVFALLTESYKMALVISGSIIESLILNKILDIGITKSLPSVSVKNNKKVTNMNLSELLYVADENNIIEVQLYHFSQALKQYRNYIHPGVEIRKGKVKKINEKDAVLSWEIAKKVICEI